MQNILLQLEQSLSEQGVSSYSIDMILKRTHENLMQYKITPIPTKFDKFELINKITEFLKCKKIEGCSLDTLRNYKYILNSFDKYIDCNLRVITTNTIRDYIEVKMQTVKNSSIEPIVWTLKSFFAYLIEEEILIKNPCKK